MLGVPGAGGVAVIQSGGVCEGAPGTAGVGLRCPETVPGVTTERDAIQLLLPFEETLVPAYIPQAVTEPLAGQVLPLLHFELLVIHAFALLGSIPHIPALACTVRLLLTQMQFWPVTIPATALVVTLTLLSPKYDMKVVRLGWTSCTSTNPLPA